MVGLKSIMNKASRKYGEGTYVRGTHCKLDFPRIPTGVFAVDYMLGGGFPVGVTSSIYGPPAGGKTMLMTRLASGVQNLCFTCYNYVWDCECQKPYTQDVVIIQTEIFDMGWAILLGLNPERVIIAEPDSGEHASDMIAECLKADDCGLVILDSLPMLTPTVELEASALDIQVGAQAKLISKLIRRVKTTLIKEKKRGHPTMFVATNQVRAKIGGFGFGPQEEQPGGFTSKHDWHVTLRMSQLKSDNMDKTTDLPIDAKFKASMVAMGNKRKVFTLHGSSEFYVTVSDNGAYLKGSINDYKTVLRYAEESGLLTKDPWMFNGKEYRIKQDIIDDWLDTESFLSAKKAVVDSYVSRAKRIMADTVPDCQMVAEANGI